MLAKPDLRIAYVINSVEGGGAQSPVPAIAAVLRQAGAEIAVFALGRRDGRGLPAMEAAGLDVRVCPFGEKQQVAALRWLHAQLKTWKPDVVWTSLTRATLMGQIVGGWLNTPVVSWQHAAFLKPANRALLRWRRSASALWIGDSESVTALTAERIAPAPDRLICWPIFAMDAQAPQATAWRQGETLRLGALGRLHPVKGYDVLLDALAQLKRDGFSPPAPFEVRIAGDGAEMERLQAQKTAAGLHNVHLVGFCAAPPRFLADLHLYLQPSRSEGLCVAAHEAMQAGLPVLASAVGELPYSIVAGETGFLAPPGDATALAAALAEALSDPERLARMGQAARSRTQTRFGSEQFVARGAAIVQRLRAMA
ncbi:glycosyltransferase family 4 protein [Caulobacter sp. RHG1]|uniref:glycosyltransferase family 4 protein n=1 Tax=Caulobacter sp. (strain RHG1) TaxID=2545762 RepID=UPI001553820A|nr:glycosyltransferase family 4 protein [Caulobacter sp. RHG1]NQE64744.1 LPS glycosyltransferase [Caulobacter sp. RHG1]